MWEKLRALGKVSGPRQFHAHEIARVDELNGLQLASFRLRACAIAIDVCIVFVLRIPLGFLHHEPHSGPVTMASLLVLGMHDLEKLVESAIYFAIALKVGKGQTVGKRLMKIRVLSLTHHQLSWWQSIERALGYGASLLEGGFGFLQFYINRNRQTVHDRMAETIVVDTRPPLPAPVETATV